jgi:hypothetical protein
MLVSSAIRLSLPQVPTAWQGPRSHNFFMALPPKAVRTLPQTLPAELTHGRVAMLKAVVEFFAGEAVEGSSF